MIDQTKAPRRLLAACRPCACPTFSVGGLLALALLTLHAEGFRSPTIGAAGLGGSGGRIVFVDDASAVAHNPANLVALPGWEASIEPTLAYHSVDFRSPEGGRAETRDPWKPMPHLFVGGPVLADRVALGLGVTVPYGLSVDWGDGGALRYHAAHYVDLKSFQFNPTVAVRLAPTLQVGAGLEAMWSEVELRQFYPWALAAGIPGLPDGEIRAKGDGVGWSGNFGVTWNFLPRHWLAATVRAPMDVDYDGDLRVSNVPGVPGGRVDGSFGTQMAFPTVVAAGYGIELSGRVRVEANVEWLEFSRFRTMPLEVAPGLPGLPTEIVHRWKDTVTAGIAARWELGRGWRARFGYQWFESPVPDYTFSPSIPDSDQHVLTVGVRYQTGRHRFEVAYAPVFYLDREIRSNQVDAFVGKYTFQVHLISAGYGFSF